MSSSESIEYEYTVPDFADYDEVLNLYRQSLKGEVSSCPTHMRRLKDESAPLVELNLYGIITIDSQPGLMTETYQKRAYVEFFLKEVVWNRIKSQLMLSDLVYFSQRVSKLPRDSSPANTPAWPLSICKDEHGLKWETKNHLLPNRSTMDINLITASCNRKAAKKIRSHLIWVVIADPVWGRKSLLRRLVVMLG